MDSNQIQDSFPNSIPTLDLKSQNNFDFQSVWPRRGWQNKQAFARVIVKTKRALDLAEIEHLIN